MKMPVMVLDENSPYIIDIRDPEKCLACPVIELAVVRLTDGGLAMASYCPRRECQNLVSGSKRPTVWPAN